MRTLDRPAVRLGISTLILFTGWAADSWRDLIGWYGFGAVVLLMVTAAVLLIMRNRAKLTLNTLPIPLLVFLALATVSIAWSFYPLSSLLGVTLTLLTTACGLAVALTLTWVELLRVLGWVFRAILGLSFVFEFIVATVFREPIFPVWALDNIPENPSKLLYWSRNLLFDGGKIQGIVGNSSLLAMVALVALIVFAIQLASRSVGRVSGTFWVLVAAGTIALTRSATIIIAVVAVAGVLAAVLLLRRVAGTWAALPARVVILIVLAAGAVFAVAQRVVLLGLLGKSADFTGRLGIWDAVIGLAQQRPVQGWGWVSWWAPWAPPFDHLIRRGGVQVLHAHNAWLDIWLQLGILGLVVAGALVLSTLVRSWQFALDRVRMQPFSEGSHRWITLLPLLILVAQLVQSLAESRMLVEGGWMFIVILAVMTKNARVGAELAVPRR
jgi:exopolysaccharide production protein ExoQ